MFDIKRINADEANASEENRMNFVATIATLTRGLDGSKDPAKLYERLMTEAYGGTPGRPMEFIPVYLNVEVTNTSISIKSEKITQLTEEQWEEIKTFSTIRYKIDKPDYRVVEVRTNMRCLLKAGVAYENIPYNKKTEGFIVVDAKIPMFSWAQFYTHTQLSKVSESDRVSVNLTTDGFDFWLPNDFVEKYTDFINNNKEDDELYEEFTLDEVKRILLNDYSQSAVRKLFADLGYPKEIWSRAIYYFQYKRFVLAGWKQNPYGWQNLLEERLNGWTQGVSKEIASQLLYIYKN